MRVLVGRMRIPPREFWALTFPEAHLLWEEYLEERRDRRIENATRAMAIGSMHGFAKVEPEVLWRSMTGEDLPEEALEVDSEALRESRERARIAREAEEAKKTEN